MLPSTLPAGGGRPPGVRAEQGAPRIQQRRRGRRAGCVHQHAAGVVGVAEPGGLAGRVQAGGERVDHADEYRFHLRRRLRGHAGGQGGGEQHLGHEHVVGAGLLAVPAIGVGLRRSLVRQAAPSGGGPGGAFLEPGEGERGGEQSRPLRDQVVVGRRAGAVERGQVAAMGIELGVEVGVGVIERGGAGPVGEQGPHPGPGQQA